MGHYIDKYHATRKVSKRIKIFMLLLFPALYLTEAIVHHVALHESITEAFLPHDVNEIWMRTLILLLIIVAGRIIFNLLNALEAN